jgi:hypothetical protein
LAIERDGDGKFNQQKDGVLAFDFNKDGILSHEEISRSEQVLNGITNPNPNGAQTNVYDPELNQLKSQIDANGDSRLSKEELTKANAKIWVDSDGNGRTAAKNEVYDAGDFQSARFEFSELKSIDRFGATTQDNFSTVTFQPTYQQPTFPSPYQQPIFQPPFQQQPFPQQFFQLFQQLQFLMMGGFGRQF